jgi:CRP-like cAMP-binding protein
VFEKYKTFFEKYVSLNFAEWNLLKSRMRVIHYEKGDIILRFGSVCTQLLFINTGLARGYLIDEQGKDYTWGLFFNDINAQMHNAFVTDYDSFLHQKPSRIEIEALEECELLSIEHRDLQFLYDNLKKGERFGRVMAEEAYSYLHDSIIDRQTKSASQRFEEFVQMNPHLLDKVPQYHIATFLGITPQHLSRLKKEYKINKCE